MNNEQRRRLEDLIARLETLNRRSRARFIAVLLELEEAKDDARGSVLDRLEAVVRQGYRDSFLEGARAQAAIGGGIISAALFRAGRILSTKLSNQVRDRAANVLRSFRESETKRGRLYARTYSAVLANETTYRGARRGMEGQARGEGKREKMFVRLAPVKEPREHSKLEGSIIGIDELWDIGGVEVSEPGHEDLPPGERINCQHGVVYL